MPTRKAILVSDEQIPYHIDLSPLNRFIKDFKPDIFIRLGDMLDMTGLLGWHGKRTSDIDWDEINSEIKIANNILDIQDSLHNAKEKHFVFGNHEERLKNFKETHDYYAKHNASTLPYLKRDLHLNKRGYVTHGQNDLFNFGKLYMFHGNDYSMYHTKNNLLAYETNLVYGHVHSPQRFTKVARVNYSPKSAWSLGCLCNRNPEWKHGEPNAWVNGFGVFYLHDNGNFNLYQIDIIKGQFVAPNGKLYK